MGLVGVAQYVGLVRLGRMEADQLTAGGCIAGLSGMCWWAGPGLAGAGRRRSSKPWGLSKDTRLPPNGLLAAVNVIVILSRAGV